MTGLCLGEVPLMNTYKIHVSALVRHETDESPQETRNISILWLKLEFNKVFP